jgi:hypothetical protein
MDGMGPDHILYALNPGLAFLVRAGSAKLQGLGSWLA